jgi:hypothetical protein
MLSHFYGVNQKKNIQLKQIIINMPEFTYYTKFGKKCTKTVVASPEAEQVLSFDAKSFGTHSLAKTISPL